jgi:hypothetical protein
MTSKNIYFMNLGVDAIVVFDGFFVSCSVATCGRFVKGNCQPGADLKNTYKSFKK